MNIFWIYLIFSSFIRIKQEGANMDGFELVQPDLTDDEALLIAISISLQGIGIDAPGHYQFDDEKNYNQIDDEKNEERVKNLRGELDIINNVIIHIRQLLSNKYKESNDLPDDENIINTINILEDRLENKQQDHDELKRQICRIICETWNSDKACTGKCLK
jgi:hypothetical protein